MVRDTVNDRVSLNFVVMANKLGDNNWKNVGSWWVFVNGGLHWADV